MNYNIKVYETNGDNSARFILGNILNNPLYVVGLNPSTADEKSPDPTLRKVMGFAEKNGFDSFVMLNLYPQRATYPNDLHKEIDKNLMSENLSRIEKLFKNDEDFTILASWSEKVKMRKYFSECIKTLYDKTKRPNISWVKIGNLTKKGHPRHPLYSSYDLELTEFDFDNYITKI